MADIKSPDSEALRLLVDSGVIDRRATLEDIARLSEQLEQTGSGEVASRWSFFVKGKYCNRDDAPAAAAAVTTTVPK